MPEVIIAWALAKNGHKADRWSFTGEQMPSIRRVSQVKTEQKSAVRIVVVMD